MTSGEWPPAPREGQHTTRKKVPAFGNEELAGDPWAHPTANMSKGKCRELRGLAGPQSGAKNRHWKKKKKTHHAGPLGRLTNISR